MPERFLTDDVSPEDPCEVLARRGLGAALNRYWSSDGGPDVRAFPSVDASTASGAIVILLDRVPSGPERDEAVEILRRSVQGAGTARVVT